MSSADRGRDQPRAMIHRRILDVAASDPDASLEAIAEEVSGASPTLVERVLDEYGDPGRESDPAEGHSDAIGSSNADEATGHVAADGAPSGFDDTLAVADDTTADDTDTTADGTGAVDDSTTTGDAETTTNVTSADETPAKDEHTTVDDTTTADDTDLTDDAATSGEADTEAAGDDTDESDLPPEIRALSDKQRRTLRALYERPDASQGDLAEELDVTRATICRRLNAIPGFEWSDRRAFADSVFGDEGPASDPERGESQSTAPETDRGSVPSDETHTESRASGGPADRDAESASARSIAREESGSRTDGSDARTEDTAPPGTTDRRLAAVEDRLAAIESQLADTGAEAGTDLSLSPALAHKVVHACMESDRLTEDEELAVLRSLME